MKTILFNKFSKEKIDLKDFRFFNFEMIIDTRNDDCILIDKKTGNSKNFNKEGFERFFKKNGTLKINEIIKIISNGI